MSNFAYLITAISNANPVNPNGERRDDQKMWRFWKYSASLFPTEF